MTLKSEGGDNPLWSVPEQVTVFNQGNMQSIFDSYPSCFNPGTSNISDTSTIHTTNNSQYSYNYKISHEYDGIPFQMPETGFRIGYGNGMGYETDAFPS